MQRNHNIIGLKIGIMRKTIYILLLCCMLGLAACSQADIQQTRETVTEVNSEPGGVAFTLTEEWIVQRAEELAASMNLKEGQTCDLLAQNTKTGTYINIIYEDLTKTEGGTLIHLEDYVKNIQENLQISSEYTYTCTEPAIQNLHGTEYHTFEAKVSMPQQQGTQYFYIRRIDDTVMIMAIGVFGEDSIESLLNL